ncbi:MAG TPA: hypothetical protein VM578_06725 [Candidatus Saccharimonadales bacterium]|nr:hypothetical protein [Candidatus Saccharimonadales bacterium]
MNKMLAAQCFLALAVFAARATATTCDVDAGYRQMYNLDFPGAHQTFQFCESEHQRDPLPHVSNAAAYLFSEFDRLHILEVELFTDDSRFDARSKPKPDLALRNAFMSELAHVETLTQPVLAANPNDRDALLAQVLANGLRSDYAAMIEKRNLASLGYMKTSRKLAQRLLQLDPSCYDAYLAVGVENYLLGVSPAPVRWMLHMGGAETDKDAGVARLKMTASHGRYLAPFARLLLAVAALRDHDSTTARTLLTGLSRDFPNNQLYGHELARIPK